MQEPVIRFEGVAFAHPDGATILHHLNLSFAPGETTAIVGRSGAGKTTILRLVNRLLLPTAGRVIVQGRDTAAWDPIRLRRSIGYVLQDVGLFPHMTVEENVSLVPRLEQWQADRMKVRARQLLEMVGLSPATFADRRPHELSGGQRQRVGLARALATDPPILLMDEPFGALDPITRMEVRREFAALQQHLRTTVVLVTHDVAEAFALGQRVGVMDAGELIACAPPEQVAQSDDPRVQALVDAPLHPMMRRS
jgi:osmoprotectant transport system ATP-binding protein